MRINEGLNYVNFYPSFMKGDSEVAAAAMRSQDTDSRVTARGILKYNYAIFSISSAQYWCTTVLAVLMVSISSHRGRNITGLNK